MQAGKRQKHPAYVQIAMQALPGRPQGGAGATVPTNPRLAQPSPAGRCAETCGVISGTPHALGPGRRPPAIHGFSSVAARTRSTLAPAPPVCPDGAG
ncbi:hypothetical protein [Pseudomonas aeruginosa]|uniref:hypothetical protein n=1 Tax=Pseudomonas aeruginosa TaxID=287 RepID=UPI003D2A983B